MAPQSSGAARDDRDLFSTPEPGWITAYCDGGSRGNPGPSGYGVRIEGENGAVLAELSQYLGIRTNNYAEYSGLLAALDFALSNGHPLLRVVSDSELMVKQMKGQYRVNSPDLRPLYEEARKRVLRLERFRIEHVLRGRNSQADRLANLAMDQGASKPAARSRRVPEAVALRGFVKNGLVHLVEGELPDGIFVRIIPE